MAVVIETTLGDITVDLFLKERPRACLNFMKLCKLKYYNFNLFHTIEQGFIAQTGDPSGTGDEGSSVWGVIEGAQKRFFEGEYIPKIRHTEPGLLSMVSTGKNMIGSQFFFTLGSDLTSLDGIHCVIGEVAEGHEVLRKINESICDESHRPYQDIRITHTVILEDPFENPRGFRGPSRSPSPTADRLRNGRIAADEDIDDAEGKTDAEIQEMLADREAKARATILEIVGDLPDADIAPPENVLFVCKLNPVTSDDDLEIIFSRFGKIKGCEVIRDKVSGDSLQYAFVEFEDKKSCEDAYFKMDNVLIDDRRIHVDFSQSVAKIKWKGKGRGIEYEDNREANKRIDFSKRNNDRGNNFNRSDVNRHHQQQPSHRNTLSHRQRSRSPRRYDDNNRYKRNDDDQGRRGQTSYNREDRNRREDGMNRGTSFRNNRDDDDRKRPTNYRRDERQESGRRRSRSRSPAVKERRKKSRSPSVERKHKKKESKKSKKSHKKHRRRSSSSS